MEKKPEVKDLVQQLATLVHWEQFTENLPEIKHISYHNISYHCL